MLLEFTELLERKLKGERWSEKDVKLFVHLVSSGRLSGEQIGAALMLIFTQGMDKQETVDLTWAMTHSGDTLSWQESIKHLVVDKHSTGGVGDMVSPPMVASLLSLGLRLPMISGRSLGHTGGTIDKMESLPGFNANLTAEEMRRTVMDPEVGGFIAGQTETMVPADRVLYAARSETATIQSIPLITSSILSKKAAEGISALVMDVKFGRAAFMTTFEDAKKLAQSIEATGRGYGMKVTAFLTEMDRPLANCVGNAVEVAEALQVINGGGGSSRLRELVARQSGCLLRHAGRCSSEAEGAELVRHSWSDGSALRAMRRMLVNQGVSEAVADDLCRPGGQPSVQDYLRRMLREPRHVSQLVCSESGFVSDIDALALAKVCHLLSHPECLGGRLDHSAGLELLVAKGDSVEKAKPWLTVYHSEPLTAAQKAALEACLQLTMEQPEVLPLIREVFPVEG